MRLDDDATHISLPIHTADCCPWGTIRNHYKVVELTELAELTRDGHILFHIEPVPPPCVNISSGFAQNCCQ